MERGCARSKVGKNCSGRSYKQILEQLASTFPDAWFLGLCRYDDTTVEAAFALIQKIIYPSFSPVPVSGKWFRTGPALDRNVQQLCMDSLLRLLTLASRHGKRHTVEVQVDLGDTSYLEEIA